MNKFLKRILFFALMQSFLISLPILAIIYSGISDYAYKRFTSSNHPSLILGTSRAAQGIQPQIINETLSNSDYQLPIYNFSFTVMDSPYGEIYYNSIVKKVSHDSNKNGLFILSVDPFGLGIETNFWDKGELREKGRCLDKIKCYYNPQIYYLLIYCRPAQWIKDKVLKLHDDGWLEVSVDWDSINYQNNLKEKMKAYYSYKLGKSEYRILWLENTIDYLEQYGEVYLCRIPVSYEMAELENELWPDFNDDINIIAQKHHIPYFHFSSCSGKYRTTDGNHLFWEDGAEFTKDLCDSIMLCR